MTSGSRISWTSEIDTIIREMASQAISDRNIAEHLGIGEDAVRLYRHRHGIEKPLRRGRISTVDRAALEPKECPICGTMFRIHDTEPVSNFRKRLSCCPSHSAKLRIRRAMEKGEDSPSWPIPMQEWPEGYGRFEDDPRAARPEPLFRMLPPVRHSPAGCSADVSTWGHGMGGRVGTRNWR